jgi:hypothetical protein
MEDRSTVQAIGADGKPKGEPVAFDAKHPSDEARKLVAGVIADAFALEPSTAAGRIPQRVVDELKHCRTRAKDFAQAYSEAIKAQAQKYAIKPGALKRYVNALEADKLEELDGETEDLTRLIEG